MLNYFSNANNSSNFLKFRNIIKVQVGKNIEVECNKGEIKNCSDYFLLLYCRNIAIKKYLYNLYINIFLICLSSVIFCERIYKLIMMNWQRTDASICLS